MSEAAGLLPTLMNKKDSRTDFIQIYRKQMLGSSCRKLVYKKGILKSFAKFTGKHLRWSLFFNNVAGRLGGRNFIQKTPVQVFPAKFVNTYF